MGSASSPRWTSRASRPASTRAGSTRRRQTRPKPSAGPKPAPEQGWSHRLSRQRRRPAGVRRTTTRSRSTCFPTRPPATPSTTGGYCPQGLSFAERTALLKSDHAGFRNWWTPSLRRHYELIKTLSDGAPISSTTATAFSRRSSTPGVTEVCRNGQNPNDGFVFPSYVEDIMGPMLFDYGYGPFRWVCLSGKTEDLRSRPIARRWPASTPSAASRTATTGSGSATPTRTGWWSAPRPASSTRTPWGG